MKEYYVKHLSYLQSSSDKRFSIHNEETKNSIDTITKSLGDLQTKMDSNRLYFF